MAHPQDREIVRLAFPAFLALVAEPTFLLADAAIVGHLGTPQLAGLGIAAVVLQTVVGLCVFLAYGTTSSVARHLGAGDLRGALAQGIDGLWLAVLIGAVTTVAGVALTGPLVAAFGAGPDVEGHATTYLRLAFLGTTPLLVMLAATGVLRGLQDTRTPLVVAVGGNGLNVVFNLLLVFGLGPVPALGIAGSALGSVLAQVASAAALTAVVVRGARRQGASLAPDRPGITAAARAAVALVIRTVTLRAALLITTYAVVVSTSSTTEGIGSTTEGIGSTTEGIGSTTEGIGSARDELGSVSLATHQLAFTIWTFQAFVLDAIAIAAQAITGRYLGAGDVPATRAVTRRMIRWGLVGGAVLGLATIALAPLLGPLFTEDQAVRDLLVPVLVVVGLSQPVAGVVFVLDGVLIGAGDGTYLAKAGLLVLAIYAPVVLAVAAYADETAGRAALVWVWVAFSVVLMGARAVVLLHRERGNAWLVTGVRTPS